MSEMKFKDIVFCGFEKEDRTGSKNSFDMSWLIQNLKAEYTVEKQTHNYYIVKSKVKKLHFIWRYNYNGDKAWTASDIAGEDLEKIKNGQDLYFLVLIRKDKEKVESDAGVLRYTIQKNLTENLNGKGKKISVPGSFDVSNDYKEKCAECRQVLMQGIFDEIHETMTT